MASSPKFVESAGEYNDIFEVFSRGCREQEKVWIENDLVPKITELFRPSPPKSQFKVLAVGSGVGSFDLLLIKALFTHGKELIEGKQVIWTVVEPNTIAIDEFKQKVSLDDAISQNVSFSWVDKGVQEFLEVTQPEQYDLIHFIHVLYYVDEELVLKNAYNKILASPGCIIAAVGSEGDIWVNLMKSFKVKIPSLASELHYPTNIELSEICKRNGWACETFDGKLDSEITEIFNDGDPKGAALLKFFFHTYEDIREKYGKELMSEIIEFFQKMSWEKVKDGKTSVFVKDDIGFLLIYKNT